jgi:hypothetical protein
MISGRIAAKNVKDLRSVSITKTNEDVLNVMGLIFAIMTSTSTPVKYA